MKKFVFFYLMTDDESIVEDARAEHILYWRTLSPPDYRGGPFADHSGGMIQFNAASAEEAFELTAGDPFIHKGALKDHWIKEWEPK